jgi:glutaredoxin
MEAKQPKVIVYSTSWCSYCHSLADWLDTQGIAYETIDVEADEQAKNEMLARTGGEFMVPVTVIGDATIKGFDRPGVKVALKKYNAE